MAGVCVHGVGACRAYVSHVSVAIYRKSLRDSHSEPYVTNADKRKAVETLLADETWAKWSNVKVAAACGVSDEMVRVMRSSLPTVGSERTYTDRHGNIS